MLKVASTGIEPVSGASETLILSIVRRGHSYVRCTMCDVRCLRTVFENYNFFTLRTV